MSKKENSNKAEMSKKENSNKPEKIGLFSQLVLNWRVERMVHKIRAQEQKDYFASEGESDPKRLEAQKQRDQEFLAGLKKVGLFVIGFLIFYAILRTILGLW